MPKWEWKVRFFYNDTVKAPKIPGELAIETVHVGESSLQMEVEAGKSRKDIGMIHVYWIGGEIVPEYSNRVSTLIQELSRG